jgi:hypothetical protein
VRYLLGIGAAVVGFAAVKVAVLGPALDALQNVAQNLGVR